MVQNYVLEPQINVERKGIKKNTTLLTYSSPKRTESPQRLRGCAVWCSSYRLVAALLLLPRRYRELSVKEGDVYIRMWGGRL